MKSSIENIKLLQENLRKKYFFYMYHHIVIYDKKNMKYHFSNKIDF